MMERMAADDLADPESRGILALANDHLGLVLRDAGRPDEAVPLHESALELWTGLLEGSRGDPDTRWYLGESHMFLGTSLLYCGKLDEAETSMREALSILEPLVADFPARVRYHLDEALAIFELARIRSEQGRFREAVPIFRKARASMEDLTARDPNLSLARDVLIMTDIHLVKLLCELGEVEQAADVLQRARGRQGYRPELLNSLAWLLGTGPGWQSRDPAEAVGLAQRAVSLAPGVARFWNTLGVAQYRAGDWDAAIDTLEKSAELKGYGDAWDFFFLAMAHWRRGEEPVARRCFEQGIAWMQAHSSDHDEHRRFRAEAAELMGLDPPRDESPGEEPPPPSTSPSD